MKHLQTKFHFLDSCLPDSDCSRLLKKYQNNNLLHFHFQDDEGKVRPEFYLNVFLNHQLSKVLQNQSEEQFVTDNPGKYLKQAIETIMAQTLKDIEIICVDDGSYIFVVGSIPSCKSYKKSYITVCNIVPKQKAVSFKTFFKLIH